MCMCVRVRVIYLTCSALQLAKNETKRRNMSTHAHTLTHIHKHKTDISPTETAILWISSCVEPLTFLVLTVYTSDCLLLSVGQKKPA